MVALHPVSLGISVYLAVSGYRKGSLSLSGALGAVIAGYASMGEQLKTFGVAMIVFYLVGSKATKYKAHVKAKLEDGHAYGAPAGNRSALQVLCNTGSAVVAALAWRALFSQDALGGRSPMDLQRTCAVSSDSLGGEHTSKALVYVALGHYACCFGDTLASELGILSRSSPRLLTTLRPVAPGTNGAVSPLGLALSALGGFLTALTCIGSLLVENAACRTAPAGWAWEMLAVGTAAGLGGSVFDSILGATLQRTWYSEADGKILTARPTAAQLASGRLKVVSGLDVIDNSTINLVSGIATALVTGWCA